MEHSDFFVALAKTGISGFALYTCYLSFRLINNSNKSSNHRLIYGYMGFSLLLALIVLSWQILDIDKNSKQNSAIHEVPVEQAEVDVDFFSPQQIQVYREGVFVDSIVPGTNGFPFGVGEASWKLHSGYKPRYLIRFINGDLITTDGILNGSAWLGDSSKKVVFAADYNELKGLPVREAIDRVGGIPFGSSVIAVIIDTSVNSDLKVNPASIRGIYKWIRDLNAGGNHPTIQMPEDADLINDINNNNGIRYHGLSNWVVLYDDYESSFITIQNNDAFVSAFSGIKYDEWNGHGFSTTKSGSGVSILVNDVPVHNYGALGFLVKNSPLRDIRNKKIIKLNMTDQDKIIPVLKN